MKNEVGMAGSKSKQTRDNRIYYTSLRLLFSTIVHLLIMVDVFVECGMWEIFVQVVPGLVVTMVRVYQFDSIALLRAIFAPLKKQA